MRNLVQENHKADIHLLLNSIRLSWAYETLSNEDSREKYDAWKRSGLSVPFKAWLSLRDANRTSMHWAGQPKKKLMLEHKSNEGNAKAMFSSFQKSEELPSVGIVT